MRTAFALYQLMLADFLERTRRYSFLVTLGLTFIVSFLFLPDMHAPYGVLRFEGALSPDKLMMTGGYRGIYNSAWVGTQLAMLGSLWLSLVGFYLVKNALERDLRTGVSQIIATTPLNKVLYTLGKALSNFAVLASIVFAAALTAGVTQVIRGEELHIDLWSLFSPFLLIALPTVALVAAVAILFECISWLRGGVGNIVYSCAVTFAVLPSMPVAFDFLGIREPMQQMTSSVKAVFPAYNGETSLGLGPARGPLQTFHWGGLIWTPDFVLSRLLWIGLALLVVLCASLFFTRFNPSLLGNREMRYQTHHLVFSTPHPLVRQLPLQWLAGVLLALATASGMALHFWLMNDLSALLALLCGACFVPTLALVLGTWTRTNKLFEVLYLLLWYIGPLNHLPWLDFMGITPASLAVRFPALLALITAVLFILAVAGRKQQLLV